MVPKSLFAKNAMQIVRPTGSDFDIGVMEEKKGQYTALLLECTHANNPLTYTGSCFVCSLHGSRFDEDGNVIHGPARLALKRLATEVSADHITILIP
jgi:Rieske Fe-S protein